MARKEKEIKIRWYRDNVALDQGRLFLVYLMV